LITVVVDEPYTAQAIATGGGSSNYSFQFEVENGVSVTFSSTINDFYDFKNWSSAQGNFISPSPESEEIMMSFEANDTITLHTVREIYGYYIPNSFSPNGDNVNDCIGPVGNAVQIDRFNWVVFNRNGELVFETDEFGDCWDGSYLGGEYYVPDGVYTYVLRVKSVFDKEIQKVSGSIIVVR
jgi:gliding motility-associated-like protein